MQNPSPATDSVTAPTAELRSIITKKTAMPILDTIISTFCEIRADSAAQTRRPKSITLHKSVAMLWL